MGVKGVCELAWLSCTPMVPMSKGQALDMGTRGGGFEIKSGLHGSMLLRVMYMWRLLWVYIGLVEFQNLRIGDSDWKLEGHADPPPRAFNCS